jgi:hypothetical protein
MIPECNEGLLTLRRAGLFAAEMQIAVKSPREHDRCFRQVADRTRCNDRACTAVASSRKRPDRRLWSGYARVGCTSNVLRMLIKLRKAPDDDSN